jgi:hypothetical protein
MKRFAPIAFVAAAVTLGGCTQGADRVLSTPTIVPPSTVETFTGTLAPSTASVRSASPHNFTVTTTSEIEVTLTAVGPPPDVKVGLGIGLPSGVGCVLTLGTGTVATVQAGSTPQIKGTAVPGNLCVSVYDVGTLTQTVSYTVTVAHS